MSLLALSNHSGVESVLVGKEQLAVLILPFSLSTGVLNEKAFNASGSTALKLSVNLRRFRVCIV
ncbi:MAG: hypothetical protein ON057_001021 [Glomeribacter sp. 1016415]|nr:hypothetical protein [Glomeribacter sp. 1016415]